MKKPPYNVVARNCLPTSLPIWQTIAFGLLLDRCHANQLVWGIAGTLLVIIWIACVYGIVIEDHVNLPGFGGEPKE